MATDDTVAYHGKDFYHDRFKKAALRWNKYQRTPIPDQHLEDTIGKVSDNIDDLVRLCLDLSEYRFSVSKSDKKHPTVIGRDFDVAIEIRFVKLPVDKKRRLEGGARPDYDKDLFPKKIIRWWMTHFVSSFYKGRLYISGEVLERFQLWIAKRFTYLARKIDRVSTLKSS